MNDLLSSMAKGGHSIQADFKSRVHQLTIDQLKHEEQVIENAIKQ